MWWTIRRQVAVAEHCIRKKSTASSWVRIKEYRIDLEGVSALDFPPALAAFAGAGSFPYMFFGRVAYDKLHVNEHGVFRQIADEIFKVFEVHPQYNGMTKGVVAEISNLHIADIPRAAQLRRFPAFLKAKGKKLAGVTGKMRRELLPFQAFSVMGISCDVQPDDDIVVTILIDMECLQRKLLGFNVSSESGVRSLAEIQDISKLGFKIGRSLTKLLNCPVNTKVHRMMHHIFDHLFSLSCFRKGTTDDDETMHKATKKGYASTNKKLAQIAPQLLSARVSLELQEKSGAQIDCLNTRTRLLLTRNPLAALQNNCDPQDTQIENEAVTSDFVGGTAIGSVMANQMKSGMSPASAKTAVLTAKHPSTHVKVWTQMKSVRFKARFEWEEKLRVWQTAYAGDVLPQTVNRRDAIWYEHKGE